jgi:FkbM family methyltransferase
MTIAYSLRQVVKRLMRLRPATVQIGPGAGLKIDMRRASGAFDVGSSELPVQEWIVRQLAAGQTFYDVGANIGFFSLVAARQVGESGNVIAFEPVPENADAIRRNADLNAFDWIIVVDVAVSSSTGEAELVLAEHPGGAALRSAAMPPDATRCITVKTATLDSLVRRKDFPPPDVVKIDVEGAELRVLQGMAGVVQDHRPKIVCEVDAATRDEADARAKEVERIVGSWGYTLARLPDSYANKAWNVIHIVGTPA